MRFEWDLMGTRITQITRIFTDFFYFYNCLGSHEFHELTRIIFENYLLYGTSKYLEINMLYHYKLLNFVKRRLIDGVILNHPVNMNHKTFVKRNP